MTAISIYLCNCWRQLSKQAPGFLAIKEKREQESDPQFLFWKERSPLDRATVFSHGNLRALDPAVGDVFHFFNTTHANTGFLWLFFSLKKRSKILKCNSVKAVFRGQFDNRAGTSMPRASSLNFENIPVCRNRCRKSSSEDSVNVTLCADTETVWQLSVPKLPCG